LDLIVREIISHLRCAMLLNLIVLPIFRSYGAYGKKSLLQMLTSLVKLRSINNEKKQDRFFHLSE
jgi:hypothetical protein